MDKEMHITKKEETNNKELCTAGIRHYYLEFIKQWDSSNSIQSKFWSYSYREITQKITFQARVLLPFVSVT